jgi:hypothetical protein
MMALPKLVYRNEICVNNNDDSSKILVANKKYLKKIKK